MTRLITAMFDSRPEANVAVERLVQELHVPRDTIQVHAADATSTTGTATGTATEDRGFWASLKDLFVPDEDRHTYAEGVRRGSVVVSARVEEGQMDRAMDVLEACGAVDLDTRESEWRAAGWTGAATDTSGATVATSPSNPSLGVIATGVTAAATTAARPITPAVAATTTAPVAATTSARAGSDEVIPIVEERLVVGKRDVERGRVRVRSYVVETPVSEQVTLRDENVHVERRAVDLPISAAGAEPFRERTIEAVEHDEEAVVAKDARVTEELVIRKETGQRTETVSDTVRSTEVEVEDDRTASGTARTTTGAKRTPGKR